MATKKRGQIKSLTNLQRHLRGNWAPIMSLVFLTLLASCRLFTDEEEKQPATMIPTTLAGPALRALTPDDMAQPNPAETSVKIISTSPPPVPAPPAGETIAKSEATIAAEELPAEARLNQPAAAEEQEAFSGDMSKTPGPQDVDIPTNVAMREVMEPQPDHFDDTTKTTTPFPIPTTIQTATETKSATRTPETIVLQTATIVPTLTIDPAGPHFSLCVSNTGGNATVGVPADIIFEGPFQLENGDEIAIFSSDGEICGGSAIWDGSSLAITVWSDDPQSDERDGIASSDTMQFRIWDETRNLEFDDIEISFAEGDVGFVVDGIYIVAAMKVTG